MGYTCEVLFAGYSEMKSDVEMVANCTCTLLRGPSNIIVDTMTPWDSKKILQALKQRHLSPEDVHYVISTHGHSDHTGNNNLFLKAKHIVGHSISFEQTYYIHQFDKGKEYVIDDNVKIIPTPGHTFTDVTVVVKTSDGLTVAVVGDLFERAEDIDDDSIWMSAGSEVPHLQRKNRLRVSELADVIVPGHGEAFTVTPCIREELRRQYKCQVNQSQVSV